jgi:hypothetical protein
MKIKYSVLFLALLFAVAALAQTPVVPDAIPVTHVSITANFTGISVNGTMQSATIDTFGLPLMQNASVTQGLNVSYQHTQIPAISQRWEMGEATYWRTLPKINAILVDTSNFNVSVSGGFGKMLSPTGNKWSFLVNGAINYPITAHTQWQVISYQYQSTFGSVPVRGVLSYSSVSTGPVFSF